MTRLGGLTFAYLINTRAISMPIVWYRQNSPLSPGHKSCAYIYWFPSPIEKVMLIYDFSYKLVLACVVLRKKTKAGSRFSSGNRSNFLWPVKKTDILCASELGKFSLHKTTKIWQTEEHIFLLSYGRSRRRRIFLGGNLFNIWRGERARRHKDWTHHSKARVAGWEKFYLLLAFSGTFPLSALDVNWLR